MKVFRKCSLCNENLPNSIEFFATKGKGLQSICRPCQKEYRRQHYIENAAKYKAKAKRYRKTKKKEVTDLKLSLSCATCGENRHWCLDFHHQDPSNKTGNIGTMVGRVSNETLKKEIDKCVALCANCHRDLHYHKSRALQQH
jgi:hypothetical protein